MSEALTMPSSRAALVLSACRCLGSVAVEIRRAMPAAGDDVGVTLACDRLDILTGVIACCLDPDTSPQGEAHLSAALASMVAAEGAAA